MKDSVVLVKEECHLLQHKKDEENEKIASEIADYIAQTRKETAEKFAREIIKEFSETVNKPDGTEEKITDWADLHESDVWKIAEQFGVNLGELKK